jgi:DNA uptake protein ComE-like DNA-binding protein
LATKTPPNSVEKTFSARLNGHKLNANSSEMKQWVKDYFFFSRKDRIAILILVFLIVITLLLPPLFKKQEKISPIHNIAIAEPPKTKFDSTPKLSRAKSYPARPLKKTVTVIDINQADTTLFIALPGIGSKLAARIIAFRSKLGGFYSVEQIGEIYGLQDSVFQKIKPLLKCNSNDIKKININMITVDELKSHPYIRYYIANNIIAYRDQHGPFQNKEEIKKVVTVTDEVYNKVSPYLVTL